MKQEESDLIKIIEDEKLKIEEFKEKSQNKINKIDSPYDSEKEILEDFEREQFDENNLEIIEDDFRRENFESD